MVNGCPKLPYLAAMSRRPKKRKPQSVRIVAGRYRGRHLSFPDLSGLRPTPDRIRETLFNWLAGHLEGARCLDLFAGSGALGFEAASRGAIHVDLVEHDLVAARALADNRTLLRAESVNVVRDDATTFLARSPRPYHGVFLDPPYAFALEPMLAVLMDGWLVPGGWVYVERSAEDWPTLAPLGSVWKERQAGNVRFGLLRSESSA